MAKGGKKLTKLKSVLKKMQSFGRSSRGGPNSNAVAASAHFAYDGYSFYDDDKQQLDGGQGQGQGSLGLHPVYVGKSRRRYLVSSDVMDHPLFRELVDRSGDKHDDDSTTVACEVVLFEHLLWMLENADPQPESLDELVDFYAC